MRFSSKSSYLLGTRYAKDGLCSYPKNFIMGNIAIFSIDVNLKSTVRFGGVIRKDPHFFELLYLGPGFI